MQDTTGQPLPNIGYNVQTYNPRTGNWDGPQLGPLLTDTAGHFAWTASVGQKVRFCVSDNYYEPSWKPKYRYTGTCWQNQSSIGSATPITLTKAQPKFTTTLQLAKAGLSMRPVEPFVTGTAAVGQTLSVDAGTWVPAGVTLSYQWAYYDATQSDYQPIAGATSSTFTPTSALAGKQLTVIVTGSAARYASATEYGYARQGRRPHPDDESGPADRRLAERGQRAHLRPRHDQAEWGVGVLPMAGRRRAHRFAGSRARRG